MAEKIVKGVDIVEKGALTEHIEQAKQLLVVYSQLDVEVKSTAANLSKISKGFKATKSGDIGTAKATSDNMTKAMLEQERIAQAQIRTKKSLLQLEKLQEQQANRTAKAIKDEGNAYKQQSKTLTDLINRYQNLAAQGRENGKVAKGMLAEINKLDAGLKKIDATVGRHQRNVGNYTSALDNLRGVGMKVTNMLGQLGLAMGVGMVIRNTVNIVKDFEQANANLASILGVTTEQTKKLQDQQLLLGGSTSYTAAQVAELQTEYAKLGFTNEEILAATEGTLFLAKAAGTDLARAAEVAGSTLRGFGLDATETGRVTDVMALSFSKSALDMEKFAESMKYVAPIAKVAGLTIEETTAMLGALANAGISGSNAGTALRQILSQLDKTGKTTSEALQDLATQGLNLAGAEEEVGKNAKTALLVLADQTKQTSELTTVLNGAAGSAKAMAEVQDNTLKGSIDRLSSAWEAYFLNLNNATGAGKLLRGTIEFLARNLTTILDLVVGR
jgi:myosin heavy subunit